ncbi:signal transduction histidine kinase [Opitutaceae bacterium TAV1]|nr:signal transduction histidine kinase [Opitutaceae bacterium TAV1]
MKRIAFPLSLKVSLWLLLNLLLLAAAAGAFLLTHSGFRWDALVAGSSGNRVQAVADVITARLRNEPLASHDALLAQFSEAYGVEFSLFSPAGRQLAGPETTLPDDVRIRVAAPRGGPPLLLPPGRRFLPGGRFPDETGSEVPFFLRPGFPARDDPRMQPESHTRSATPKTGADKRDDPATNAPDADGATPFARLPDGNPAPASPAAATAHPPGDTSGERFLVRAGEPAAWWIGVRLPRLAGQARSPFLSSGPVLLLRAPSLGSAALLLDFKPWLLTALVTLGFSVLFWLPLVRSITRALGQLTRATERIAEGHFDTRVDERRGDEIGRLGGAVNRMAGQLDHLVNGQRRFLGDIAHELGSPLGRMQFAVGILEERAGEDLQPSVANVREEVQQMSALVHELLTLTRAGLRPRHVDLAAMELAPLVARVVAREAAGAEDRVAASVSPGLAVQADPELLARALGNLVRNALRYAGDAPGPITLSARAEEASASSGDGSSVVITIEDDGPGVPPDTLTRLGEPFYRPEFARSRETGGVGLGLAIVKSAVEACRGSVQFANRSPHGFRAEIRLAAA